MLNIRLVTSAAVVFTTLSFVLCVLFGLVAPERLHMVGFLESVLPGFEWISPGAFVLGLVESVLWGVYLGGGYAWIYNTLLGLAGRSGGSTSRP